MIISIIKKYVWILNILILILIAYVVASIINDGIKDKLYSANDIVARTDNQNVSEKYKNLNTRTPPRSYYDIILKNSMLGAGAEREAEGETGEKGKAPKTSLNVQLLGTFLNTSGNSIAVLKNMDTGMVNGYIDGDIVDIITNEKVKLVSVENCRATINRGHGGTETIECKRDINLPATGDNNTRVSRRNTNRLERQEDESSGVKLIDDNKWQIDKKMLDELLADPTSLINQARVVPQKDGMRFFGIRPSSIFYKIGLRNGDTIHRINDVELSDVENALSLFGELKNESHFNIDFTRRGKKYTYEYTVN